MDDLIERLSNLTGDELQKVVDEDAASDDAPISFELEGILMNLVRERTFPESETFGDLDAETPGERTIRVLIESLGIPESLSAILAIADDGGEDEDSENDEEEEDDDE